MVSLPRLYPRAQVRILYPDDSTPVIDTARLQLCFHTMSGYLMGSEAQWITNGSEGVRSHFGIGGTKDAAGSDGKIIQWNALNRQAYAQNNGNPYCISVETSDGAVNGLPWSDAQLNSIVDLIVWFSKLCGKTRPQLASRAGEFGTITYHQQFDTFNTHNHDCPGSVRRGQLTTVAMPRAIRAMSTGGSTVVDSADVAALKTYIDNKTELIIAGGAADPGHPSHIKAVRTDINGLKTKLDELADDLVNVNLRLDEIISLVTPATPPEDPSNGA